MTYKSTLKPSQTKKNHFSAKASILLFIQLDFVRSQYDEVYASPRKLPTDDLGAISRFQLAFYEENGFFATEFDVIKNGYYQHSLERYYYQMKNIDNKIVYILATPKKLGFPEQNNRVEFVALIKAPLSKGITLDESKNLYIICRRNDLLSNRIEEFSSLILSCPPNYNDISKDFQVKFNPTIILLSISFFIIVYSLISLLRKKLT